MLKQITIILTAVILCGTASTAQISRAEYEKLVDYVNCYYVKALIDNNLPTFSERVKNYYTQTGNKLSVTSYSNALSYNDIKNVIDSKHTRAIKLCDEINKKKDSFDDKWNRKKIITELLKIPNGYPELDKAKNNLQKDLQKQIQIPDSRVIPPTGAAKHNQPDTAYRKDESNVNTRNNGGGKTSNESKNSFSWLLWLVLGIGGGIFVWEKWIREKILPFSNRKKSQSNQNDAGQLQNDRQVLKKLKKKYEELERNNKDLKKENDAIRKECDEKQQRIEKVSQELRKNQQIPKNVVSDIEQQSTTPAAQTIGNASSLYAKSIVDGKFYGVKEQADNDTIFELKLKSGGTQASVTLYAAAYTKVLANTAFLNGCDKDNIFGNTAITIMQEGTAEKEDSSGNWKVKTQLKVEIR